MPSHKKTQISSILRDLRAAAEQRADIGTLVDRLLARFGGVEGLADETARLYNSIKAPTAQKVRLLTEVLALIKSASAQPDPLAEYSDEELEAILADVTRGPAGTSHTGCSEADPAAETETEQDGY